MTFPNSKRLIWTAIIVVVLTVSIGPVANQLQLEKLTFGHFDSKATLYVDAALKRAGAAFLTARAFNATISVFQESELQLEPGGVGVSLALGQALDPINDLIERFSWVLLASLTSLGIQKFFIEISPFVSVHIVLVMALCSFLVGLWLPMVVRDNFRKLGQILLITAIMIRIAVPAMAYLNNQVYVVFLQERHDESIVALGQTVADLESSQLNGLPDVPGADQDYSEPDEKQGWLSRTKTTVTQTFGQGKRMLDIRGKIESIKNSTLGLVDRIVDLIVVFVLTTIILPLLFLWGILKLGQLVVSRRVDFTSTNRLKRRG